MLKDQMEEIYKTVPPDKIPWNEETPPEILKNIVDTSSIKPCKAIELGCGAGNYVIYLAKQGFDMTGIDFSETAIKMAKKTASEKNIKCNLITSDVLGDLKEVTGTFDFAYDWEVLHHIFPKNREKYISNVLSILNTGAKYMSVCFSEDSPQFGGKGKYRKTPLDTTLYFSSEKEISDLVEPHFNIVELKTVEVQGKFAPHLAIYALMEKK